MSNLIEETSQMTGATSYTLGTVGILIGASTWLVVNRLLSSIDPLSQ